MTKQLPNTQDSQDREESQQARLGSPAARSLLIFAVVAGLAAVGARFVFRTHLPLTWDSVQFVLGVVDYDIVAHQPHPPGYFLYIHTAKALGLVGLPPYLALVTMSLCAGGLTVGLMVWWAGRLLGPQGGVVAGALVLFSPLAWLYATRGDTYAVSGFFALLVGYLCWRMLTDPEQSVWPAALVMGVAGGVRPTDALFLVPLWLWAMRGRQGRQIAIAIAIFAVVTSAWVVPMVAMVGGIARYREVSAHLSRMLIGSAPMAGNLATFKVFGHQLVSCGAGLLLAGSPLLLLAGRRYLPRALRTARAWPFLAIWSAPALVFYVLIHFGQAGYMMLVLGPAVLMATTAIVRLSQSLSLVRLAGLVLLVVLLNGIFIGSVFTADDERLQRSFANVQRILAGFEGTDTVALTGMPTRGEPRAEHPMLNFRLAMYLAPHLPVYTFPLEWSRLYGGDPPNYAHHMKAERVSAPVVRRGIRNLVLVDPRLRRYLPPAASINKIWDDGEVQVYLIELDATAPLRLGADGHMVLTAAPGGMQ
ncbi:MAG: DUF2723 domain-containing protein [Armatimonadetes bacterium]|nr:DUF2723 domain-containing protein [Armatimonadota bacterium]